MDESIPFGTSDFAENPLPRVSCVLLLDTSDAMRGKSIDELNAGMLACREHLLANSLASKRADIAIVTFGPVRVAMEFTDAEHFNPPTFTGDGNRPVAEAVSKAIDMLRERKQLHQQNGVAICRPGIFLISAGGSGDSWQEAAARVKAGEATRAFAFYAVGVENADMETLRPISSHPPLKLSELVSSAFTEFFI